jgi:hypothetical protein
MKRPYPALILYVCLAACVSLPSLAGAQDPDGAIEGVVTDKSQSLVANAHVAAKNLDTGFSKETRTGPNGLFRLPLLPVGRYSVTVDATNFATIVRSPFQSTSARRFGYSCSSM